ncbi:hypothetical protein [Microbacterium sp. NIBRBAC000506063]|uniref:hypothetical protein n=1 Tax=Microbacterium sp. NIBRBAC000506063 TaxID=2734618 RepID=UPI001BB6C5A0|nr:hypothetical protein [Microbacterium sp. NIBRBAC000506063]QTV79181.1 hypothetical protein KAE78_08905 [Microbacterium sp. NIBRBAC000506063]
MNSKTSPKAVYSSGSTGSPPPRMTSLMMRVPSGNSATIAATSSAAMCLAASIRNPATPSDSRSSRWATIVPRTRGDAVSRSARFTSSQVCTCSRER